MTYAPDGDASSRARDGRQSSEALEGGGRVPARAADAPERTVERALVHAAHGAPGRQSLGPDGAREDRGHGHRHPPAAGGRGGRAPAEPAGVPDLRGGGGGAGGRGRCGGPAPPAGASAGGPGGRGCWPSSSGSGATCGRRAGRSAMPGSRRCGRRWRGGGSRRWNGRCGVGERAGSGRAAYRGEAARGRRAGNARREPGRIRLRDPTVSEILTGPRMASGLGIPPFDPTQT